ncbi:MAG: O-antigen ligase family protein [Acidimicrobiales bacterium]
MHASTGFAIYVVLLMAVPARLIIRQIGAPGTAAGLWALGLLVWWAFSRLGAQHEARQGSAVRLMMMLLTVAVLGSYVASMSHGWYAPAEVRGATDLVYDLAPSSVPEITAAMISAADRGLVAYFGWLAVVLVAIDGLRTWRHIDRVVKVIVFAGTFAAAIGMLQYFTGINIAPYFKLPGFVPNGEFGYVDSRGDVGLRRVQSTASGAIEFGVVMAATFPLALHQAIFAAKSRWRWLPTCSLGLAASLSISRSAILVLGIVVLVMFAGWPSDWRKRALYVLPVGVVGIRLAAPGVLGTIRSLFLSFSSDNSVDGRTEDYGVVWNVFLEHAVLGRGLFTFVPRYYRILDNQVLMLLLELGLIGALLFVATVVTAIGAARRCFRRAGDEEHRHLGLALSASLSGVFVSFFTFDALGFAMAAGFLFVLVALAGAASRTAASDVPATARKLDVNDRSRFDGRVDRRTDFAEHDDLDQDSVPTS